MRAPACSQPLSMQRCMASVMSRDKQPGTPKHMHRICKRCLVLAVKAQHQPAVSSCACRVSHSDWAASLGHLAGAV